MKIRDFSVLCRILDYKLANKFTKITIIDALIGWMILSKLDVSVLHETIWILADVLARNLDNVITILENNPAGLKLIIPVNQTLASFFRYHIYLWTTFISFLQDPKMTRFVCFFLVPGISTFLAALCDAAKFFLVHFLCFDAYATRLWTVCRYTIGELWGLVRGKKWNPLRKRTDNILLDPRQQFLSTSLFVILLLILPTILVYFIVFRILRLMVNSILLTLNFCSTYPLGIFNEEYNFLHQPLNLQNTVDTEV